MRSRANLTRFIRPANSILFGDEFKHIRTTDHLFHLNLELVGRGFFWFQKWIIDGLQNGFGANGPSKDGSLYKMVGAKPIFQTPKLIKCSVYRGPELTLSRGNGKGDDHSGSGD